MEDKTLKDKAINFKGKDYVQVKDRVNYFNEIYIKGSIVTELLSTPDADKVIVKATVSTGEGQTFTGMSQANFSDSKSFVNSTSALENAETSAVGRALAFMGIGVIESIASIDEVNKANNLRPSDTSETVIKRENGSSIISPMTSLGKCPKCGGKNVLNPKTGNIFCENRCWLPENKHLQTLSTPQIDNEEPPF